MASIVTLIANQESEQRIRDYLEENGIANSRSRFHTTAYYAQTQILFPTDERDVIIQNSLPITINSNGGSLELDLFGEDKLVLRYQSREIESLRNTLLIESLRQALALPLDNPLPEKLRDQLEQATRPPQNPIYIRFKPHITVADDFTGNPTNLPRFTKSITFSTYSAQC